MENEPKKKFSSKEYYERNKDKILAYNREYFKKYYIMKKRNNFGKNQIKVKVEPFFCIIKRNVKVIF